MYCCLRFREQISDRLNLIEKGCRLGLCPNSSGDGQSTVSLLEQVAIMIYPEQFDNQYKVLVDRGYAAFVWIWRAHAIKEFNPVV